MTDRCVSEQWEYTYVSNWNSSKIADLGLKGWEAFGVTVGKVYMKRRIKEQDA